jgi:hypothetical protein
VRGSCGSEEESGRNDERSGCGCGAREVDVLADEAGGDREEVDEEDGGKGDAERDVGRGMVVGSGLVSISISSASTSIGSGGGADGGGDGGDTDTDVEPMLDMEVNDDEDEFIEPSARIGFSLSLSFPSSLLVFSFCSSPLAAPNFSVTFFFPLGGAASTTTGGGVSLTCGKPTCGPRKFRMDEKCSQSWYAT